MGNALNQSVTFALLYGRDTSTDLPHLGPRKTDIARLYQLHLSNPNKYNLKFRMDTWYALNSRWVVPLGETVNRLRLLRKAERPTFEELGETGMSLDAMGGNISTLPDTFALDSREGYFQVQILGASERDFDRARRGQYYRSPNIHASRNAGDPTNPGLVYGPSMAIIERRIPALNSPETTNGAIICRCRNSHMGCAKAPCHRCDNGGKVTFSNIETVYTFGNISPRKGELKAAKAL